MTPSSETVTARSGLSLLEKWAVSMALLALGLGLVGFWLDPPAEPGVAAASAVLRTLQLFLLQIGPDGLKNEWTWIAAFLAPVAALSGAGAMLERGVKAAMNWKPDNSGSATDLFIGGGRQASRIVAATLQGDPAAKVRWLDEKADCALAKLNDPQILRPIAGNAEESKVLVQAGVRGAMRVWVTCGSDEANLRVLRTLAQLPAATLPPSQRWLVDMKSRHMIRAAEQIFKRTTGASDEPKHAARIEYFDAERLAARRLFQTYGPEFSSPEDAPLHLAVLGTGACARAIVLHAIEHLVLHEDPAKSVQISWFGSNAAQQWADLQHEYPTLNASLPPANTVQAMLPLAQVTPFDVDEQSLPLGLWQQAQTMRKRFAIVLVAGDDTVRTAMAARQATRLERASGYTVDQGVRVVACFYGSPIRVEGQASSFEDQVAHNSGFKSFRSLEGLLSHGESYPGMEDDKTSGVLRKPGDSEWNLWSRRKEKDHQRLVAARLKCNGTLDDRIKGIEHRRYLVERLLDGWLPITPEMQAAMGKEKATAEYLNSAIKPTPSPRGGSTLVAAPATTDIDSKAKRIAGCNHES